MQEFYINAFNAFGELEYDNSMNLALNILAKQNKHNGQFRHQCLKALTSAPTNYFQRTPITCQGKMLLLAISSVYIK